MARVAIFAAAALAVIAAACPYTMPTGVANAYRSSTCTGYQSCMTTFTTCKMAASTCAAATACGTAAMGCLNNLTSQRTNQSSNCASWATELHTAMLAASTGGYSGSALQQGCMATMCTWFNGTWTTSCANTNVSTLCMAPAAMATTTMAATTTAGAAVVTRTDAPAPVPATPAGTTFAVTASLSMSGDFTYINTNATGRMALQTAIISDIAGALGTGVTTSDVFILSMNTGFNRRQTNPALFLTFGISSTAVSGTLTVAALLAQVNALSGQTGIWTATSAASGITVTSATVAASTPAATTTTTAAGAGSPAPSVSTVAAAVLAAAALLLC